MTTNNEIVIIIIMGKKMKLHSVGVLFASFKITCVIAFEENRQTNGRDGKGREESIKKGKQLFEFQWMKINRLEL